MFQGFSQRSVDFLWELRFNNERSWFLAHKEEFLTFVDTPMKELAQQITQAMEDTFPELRLETKVSRIYRDARRLHGRGPYKDHLWFSMRRPGTSEAATPCFYFELAPEYYSIGMGCYDATPLTMAKFRQRIDCDPGPITELAKQLLTRPEFQLYGECYKRSKGNPGPLLYPWYNRRQIGVSADFNCDGILFTPQLADQILDAFHFLEPYYRYFRELPGDAAPNHD